MKAIILAAGRGSRMQGLSEAQPKCLTRLGDRPLLEWQLGALRQAGITETAVVKGYRGELLERPDLYGFENPRWAQTNMVMSLWQARAWLESGPCIVSYGDIVYAPDVVRALIRAEGDLLISYDRDWQALWEARFVDPLADAESFQLDVGGRLTDIGRKVTDPAEIQGQYMGLLRFTPAGWAQVSAWLETLPQATRDRLDMTGLLQQLLGQGVQIGAVPIEGGWTEIDSETDLETARRLIADHPAFAWLRQELAKGQSSA